VSSLKGFIQNGQVVLPRPAEFPDGTEVRVLPVNGIESEAEDQPLSPEAITRLLALMDQVQPFELTEAERDAYSNR